MKSLNPELDKQIDGLAEICCDALNRTAADTSAQAEPLIQALVRGGYARLSDVNLQYRVEMVAVRKCPELAIHRRGELGGITKGMQETFSKLVTWQTQSPRPPDGTQATNISSAADA